MSVTGIELKVGEEKETRGNEDMAWLCRRTEADTDDVMIMVGAYLEDSETQDIMDVFPALYGPAALACE